MKSEISACVVVVPENSQISYEVKPILVWKKLSGKQTSKFQQRKFN